MSTFRVLDSYEHDVIYFSRPCNEGRYYCPHFADKERGIKKNIQYNHDSNPSLSDSEGSQLLLGLMHDNQLHQVS